MKQLHYITHNASGNYYFIDAGSWECKQRKTNLGLSEASVASEKLL